ncbi:Hypothetical predicted protein [Mytilus galloprovincialis]|uniref:Uncharacterized protein n=1 Tax=Mytilus galloprovincialis TaxID=29158 RepID=A0A8B6G6T7_MYTGA|nr:Hypothetical predicted protein [Mytilus galloprovincialis]
MTSSMCLDNGQTTQAILSGFKLFEQNKLTSTPFAVSSATSTSTANTVISTISTSLPTITSTGPGSTIGTEVGAITTTPDGQVLCQNVVTPHYSRFW